LTSPLYPLMRWSSHLCLCFLQVLRPRAPARHRPVPHPTLLLIRAGTGTLPGRPLSLRLTRVPSRHLWLRLRASLGRSSCTSAGPGLRRHLHHHRWPLLHRRHQWRYLPLRQGHRAVAAAPTCSR
jgi:hypothetical protein